MKKHTLSAIIILLSCALMASAQKLPNKQEVGVYTPADLKIDGSAKEWGDTFQAYNHAVEASYTIANDEEQLYMVFRATEEEVIQKMIVGGITIEISPIDKVASQTPVSVTYPVVPWVNSQVNYDLKSKAPWADEDIARLNKKISDHLKEIKVSGIKDLPENSISVYNDQGIKGAHYIDRKRNYTCEISLPLKYIRHLVSSKGTFVYRVQVSGIDLKTTVVVGGKSSTDPTPPSADAVPHGLLYDTSPTYFTATYTLAKK